MVPSLHYFLRDGSSIVMGPLRSNVWSTETLSRGVEHTTLQRDTLLAYEQMSDQDLWNHFLDSCHNTCAVVFAVSL